MSITEIDITKFDTNGHDIRYPGTSDSLVVVHTPELGPVLVGADLHCGACDAWPRYEIEGNKIRATEPCLLPNGITTVIELAVPSGKMIITDDLRPVYNVDRDEFASYNTVLGQAQYIEAMAAIGCAYGPVRNSSPGLYRLTVPGKFIIASPAYSESEDDWGDERIDFMESVYHDAEEVAGICTDLWAYSICDHDDYLARGGDPENLKQWSWNVVDVTPGTYRFTHHTGERGFDWDADERVFAHVELVR